MKTIRDYINIVTEAPVQSGSGGAVVDASGNPVQSGTPAPAPDAAAAAKAKLTPSQLKWLGGADPTDSAIMARMPKPQPGEQVPGAPAQSGSPAPAAAPAAAPAPAAPDTAGAYDDEGNMMPGWSTDENGNPVKVADQDGKTFVEPATQASADKSRADAQAAKQAANGVNAQGQNVTIANADGSTTNPETGVTTPAGGSTAQAAAPAPAQSGSAAPNRDSMSFGQAFADARAKGEKEFTWKGKPYAVKLAPPGQAPAKPAASGKPAAPAQSGTPATPQVGKPAGMGKPGPTVAAAQGADPSNPLNQPKKESRQSNDAKFVEELNLMRVIAGLR